MLMQKKTRTTKVLIKAVAFVLFLLAKIVFWERKRIWLVACGGERWADNADAFWQYMNNEHPEIKTLAVLKNKKQLENKKDNWIKRASLYNFILILKAEVSLATHSLSDIGSLSILDLSRIKKVWLQHGVIGIKKIKATDAKSGHYDLVCASSVREKAIMTEELGIKPNIIKITGLARHDLLKEKIQTRLQRTGILYIPTKREQAISALKKVYEDMLFSWIKEMKRKGLLTELKVWLHPGWHKRGLGDLGLNCNKIHWYELDKNPQQLICESKLLITDYSSIYFDAALSGIPTIFYQPDRQEYIRKKGLFDDFLNETNLLVVETENELIVQIENIMSNKNYYQERVARDQKWAYKYVETFDGNSCRRIYERVNEIIEHDKNK